MVTADIRQHLTQWPAVGTGAKPQANGAVGVPAGVLWRHAVAHAAAEHDARHERATQQAAAGVGRNTGVDPRRTSTPLSCAACGSLLVTRGHQMLADTHREVPSLSAGQIGAAVGLRSACTGEPGVPCRACCAPWHTVVRHPALVRATRTRRRRHLVPQRRPTPGRVAHAWHPRRRVHRQPGGAFSPPSCPRLLCPSPDLCRPGVLGMPTCIRSPPKPSKTSWLRRWRS